MNNSNPRLEFESCIYEIEHRAPPPEVFYIDKDVNDDYVINEVMKCGRDNLDMNILKIEQIVNQTLEKEYENTKRKYEEKYGEPAKSIHVFHGLPLEMAEQVSRYNLNWRRCRNGSRGWGVFFSKFPNYARYFPQSFGAPRPGEERCILAFDMLVGRKIGIDVATLKAAPLASPPEGFDTVEMLHNENSQSDFESKNVYIKFYDHEFIPKFKIIYETRG